MIAHWTRFSAILVTLSLSDQLGHWRAAACSFDSRSDVWAGFRWNTADQCQSFSCGAENGPSQASCGHTCGVHMPTVSCSGQAVLRGGGYHVSESLRCQTAEQIAVRRTIRHGAAFAWLRRDDDLNPQGLAQQQCLRPCPQVEAN